MGVPFISVNPSAPVAVTMGEPAGIGGELTLLSWLRKDAKSPQFFAIDDPKRLEDLSKLLNLNVPITSIATPGDAARVYENSLPVLPVGSDVLSTPGIPASETAVSVCTSIEMAVGFCCDGSASAVATAPIQKNTLYDAGFAFPGHTEFIAHLVGESTPVMMIASPELRVVPVTVHQPLVAAIRDMNVDAIVAATRIAAASLSRDFGIPEPRLAMAGLNPHAGEEGNLGQEEQTIIKPAISVLQAEGINISGPVPPDSLFTARARATYDLAICHYHDQALIPVKALDVDNAVNVTLGLPIVRTSPDHGTALDIAGTGRADPSSFMASLRMAKELAHNRAQQVS